MRRLALATATAAASLALAACGGGGSKSAIASSDGVSAAPCPKAWAAGWQRLADRIGAPVYCPRWFPSPLDAKIGGPWNTINSVSKDRSYLMGFAWQEKSEEVHVNLRGYPGTTRVPTCEDVVFTGGKPRKKEIPCFSDPRGEKRLGGISATVYTVNQGADQWHVLYAWQHDGSLYTLSEHVAAPLTYRRVVQNLDRMLRTLVLVEPRSQQS